MSTWYTKRELLISLIRETNGWRSTSEKLIDDEIKEIMKDYDLDKDEAEEVKDLADELGVDTDDAHEIWESM